WLVTKRKRSRCSTDHARDQPQSRRDSEGEHRLRDLNDEINKLLRERWHWERRIVELGGPNYNRHGAKMTDLEGNIVEADEVLATVTSARRRSFPELGSFSRSRRKARKGAAEVVSVGAAKEVLFEEEEDVVEEERKEREREREKEEKEREFVVHVPLPDEKMVLLKKKMELLREYASEGLVEQEKEAKAMLNIHR
ncbi:unnamed protein product, partial [Brassica rapa subsp. narinosa]